MRYGLKRSLGPLLLVSGTLLASCGGGGSRGVTPDQNPGLPPAISTTPDNTGDGWSTSTPAAQGIDAAPVNQAMQDTRAGVFTGVDSIVVVRHGLLVAEGYFNGYGRDTLHDLRSTGKSFTSALTGIAIDQGLLGLDEPISQILPQFDGVKNLDDRKRAITVRNLLNMQTGLACNDQDPTSPGNEENMYPKDDWVKFILDLPMLYQPGTTPTYCTGGVVVLGKVLSQRSGMGLDAYANLWLFGPLDIRSAEWRRDPAGNATGGGGLKLRPRDAAKLGQLYLNGGTWNGVRVVPAEWVEASKQTFITLHAEGYGLLWWKRTFWRGAETVDSYYTNGNGGNFIIVIPGYDLVTVFTASNYNSPAGGQPFDILEQRLLPAVH